MDSRIATILGLLNETTESLARSFAVYWPADDWNDPAERNVSIHFAHALIASGFTAFAEADHPDREAVQGIDLLGLAPDNSWFLGCEFKRLFNEERLLSFSNDVQRLRSFRPRSNYDSSKYSPSFEAAANCCRSGYGVVGGLHWGKGSDPSSRILGLWNDEDNVPSGTSYTQVLEQLRAVNAIRPEPQFVAEFPTGGRYYFLAAVFQVV